MADMKSTVALCWRGGRTCGPPRHRLRQEGISGICLISFTLDWNASYQLPATSYHSYQKLPAQSSHQLEDPRLVARHERRHVPAVRIAAVRAVAGDRRPADRDVVDVVERVEDVEVELGV